MQMSQESWDLLACCPTHKIVNSSETNGPSNFIHVKSHWTTLVKVAEIWYASAQCLKIAQKCLLFRHFWWFSNIVPSTLKDPWPWAFTSNSQNADDRGIFLHPKWKRISCSSSNRTCLWHRKYPIAAPPAAKNNSRTEKERKAYKSLI